jgi:hypothetical protein
MRDGEKGYDATSSPETRRQFERFLDRRTPCVDDAEQAMSDHCLRQQIADGNA